MDRLESLTSTIQNITLYDIKSMYNQVLPLSLLFIFPPNLLTILTHQAKNVVLNISEMEAKVREATNDEPWCVKKITVLRGITIFQRYVGVRAQR